MANTLSDAGVEIARLGRRLERERAARREAEKISELVTRDLYDRRAELELLEIVAAASNQAATIEEAILVALERVCGHTGWPVGHVYMLDRDTDRLIPGGIWHLDDPERYARFREITEATSCDSGEGLAGRVAASGTPTWITDVSVDPNFPRAHEGSSNGVRSAFAFPVVSAGRVVAVLEFFSPSESEPNNSLLRLMGHIGSRLGHVVDRAWAKEEHDQLTRQTVEERDALSRRTELLLAAAGEGIYGLDAEGRTTFINPAAAGLLGRRPEETIGLSVHDIVHCEASGSAIHSPDACPILALARDGETTESSEDTFFRADGTSFPAQYILTTIRDGDRVTGAVLTFNDVTDRKRIEAELIHLAEHDVLTQLYNRRRFEEELERQVAYAQRYGGGAALLLDIDNFKYVNDSLGHQAGDELIRGTAGLLRERLRSTDVLARLGGDEFAILLPRVDHDQALSVASDLVSTVSRHIFTVGERPVRVTTSVGVTMLDEAELTAEEVLVQADTAMYEAKETGRNRYAAYTGNGGQQSQRTTGMAWTKRITQALENEGFLLYCQPILEPGGATPSRNTSCFCGCGARRTAR